MLTLSPTIARCVSGEEGVGEDQDIEGQGEGTLPHPLSPP